MSISGVFVDRPSVIVNSMPYRADFSSYFRREPRYSIRAAQKWAKSVLNWQYMCYVLARSKDVTSRRHELLAAFCRRMAFGALSKHNDATIAEYIGGFQALRKKLTAIIEEIDRRRIVFEGPESSSRRCAVCHQTSWRVVGASMRLLLGWSDE